MTQIVKAQDFGLEESKGNELTSGLKTILAEREILINEFSTISKLELAQENLPIFKKLRLDIVRNRTQVEKWHTANKSFFLNGGRFVDSIKNKEIFINKQMEDKLMDAEKHFENLEKERIRLLNDVRRNLVSPYVHDVENLYLAEMEEDIFEAYLLTKKNNHLAIIKAEREAEEARLKAIKEEKEEQERVRLENIKLKADAEARELDLKKEREEVEKKQKAIELKAQKEKEEIALKLKKEAEEKAKIQNELNIKIKAEQKIIKEKEILLKQEKENARIALLAPQKEKITLWVNSFEISELDLKGFDQETKLKASEILEKFSSFKIWANQQIKNVK